ncbi:NADPH:quinone oxidoreductase family protein [Ramlibacter sp.]|uniref:NADPH:quinone oxidoreductase family protein n=1 Tax=Ramlibacter sp. TaxID=1917967 RepID=UPI003D0D523D
MHGWMCDALDGYEALQWREAPTPQPKAGEVLVHVKAASLNFPDLLLVAGKYQGRPELPFVPGTEFAGDVVAVGEGVTTVKPGQRVACRNRVGGFGTHAVLPASGCTVLPPEFSYEDASAMFVAYATSHHALIDRGQLKAGETVLVLGAAGGVGSAAVEIAKVVGAKVIAAVSSEEKCEMCRKLGADVTINYGTKGVPANFRDLIAEATDGKGPDVIYDPVGGDYAEPAFRSIAWRGRFLVVGFAGGPIPKLPLNLPLLKGASIVGVVWGTTAAKEPHTGDAVIGELARWYVEGKIKPVVERVMPMSELKAACAHMAARGVKGKLVLVN